MSIERDFAIFNAILSPFYGEEIEMFRSYKSPLPDRQGGDSRPSFQIYPGELTIINGEEKDYSQVLYWKDWGYTKHLGHRPQHLLMHMNPGMTLDQAKEIIRNGDFPEVEVRQFDRKELKENSSYILSRRELDYWSRMYIPKQTLKTYKVAGARQLYYGEEMVYDHNYGPTTFIYKGPDIKFQLYRPKPKWFSRSAGKAFVLGYEQLPYKGRVLLIVSGMKDGLCMHTATGWPFLSGSGETDFESIGDILPELRQRFDFIGVCMDPDTAGKNSNSNFATELNIPTFEFPYPDEKHDIADLMVTYGPDLLRKAFFNKTKFPTCEMKTA